MSGEKTASSHELISHILQKYKHSSPTKDPNLIYSMLRVYPMSSDGHGHLNDSKLEIDVLGTVSA